MSSVYRKIIELIDQGRTFAVATVAEAKGSVPGKQGVKMIVFPDGRQFGTVGGAGLEEKVKALARKALETGKGGLQKFDLMYYKEGALDSLCGGSVVIMIEVHKAVPHILIAGGGHCGYEVARLCDQLGYFHSVLDDRPEFASKERFPNAKNAIVAKPGEFFQKHDVSPYTHVLILGYSHRIDTDLLFDLLPRFPGWIGCISSKTKRLEMSRRLKARGITDEQLARVEAPVGLAIGAESPAEIAVSILGSIIQNIKGPVGENVDAEETKEV